MAHKLTIDQYVPGEFWDPFAVFNQVPNQGSTFPPYNIYKLNGSTYVEIAVAGFSRDELSIDFSNGVLSVSGSKTLSKETEGQIEYVHRGLAYRKFERKFSAYNMKLVEVTLINGIIVAELAPVKESPNKINIKVADRHPALTSGINKTNVEQFSKRLVEDETRPW